MYSKDEARQLKKDFWISFSNYTKFYSNKVGESIEWMLYKTGIKGLELKFEIANKHIAVMIEVNASSTERSFELYVALDKYRAIISDGFDEQLEWIDQFELDKGKSVSRIYIELASIKYHNQDNWPEIFKFMAENMYQLQSNFENIHDILKEEFSRF